MTSFDPVIELRIDQKILTSPESERLLQNLSIRCSGGETLRLVTGDDLVTEALVSILRLEDLDFIGELRILGHRVTGHSPSLDHLKTRFLSSIPATFHDETERLIAFLARAARPSGLVAGDDPREIEAFAKTRYGLVGSPGRRLLELAPAEKQLLSMAMLDLTAPRLVVVDGRRTPYPGSRIVVEATLEKLSTRCTIVVVETTPAEDWAFLRATPVTLGESLGESDAVTRTGLELVPDPDCRLDGDQSTEGEAMPQPRYLERIPVRRREGTFFVDLDEVDWIEAAGNHVRLHTSDDCHEVRATMKRVESVLDPDKFVRVHRSAIVRVDSIRELSRERDGRASVHLDCGEVIRLSRGYSRGVRELASMNAAR